jgi:hypothetical protein
MIRGREGLRAIAVFAAVLAFLALGMNREAVRATAAEGAPKRVTNSLTTQFPLGRQKLCCVSKPRRRATSPPRASSTVSRTTPATSSTSATTSARASSSRTTSQPPLLGQRGDGSAAPFIVVGAVIVACLIAAEIGRLSVRRRRRARRTADVAPASADAAPASAVTQRPARVAPDPHPPASPARSGSSGADVADEELVADPLAQLEREILARGAAARAAVASRRRQPGEGTYRLGEVLYERGRLEEAAAAWRLAASKQHAGAAARLAELLKETGDSDPHS